MLYRRLRFVLVKHFCNSTTYIFKNDIELHKEFDNHYMNVAYHGCPTISNFFNGTCELFICMVAMQCHWGVIVWVASLTHALLASLRCTEINELLRCVLAALITMQQKLLAFRFLRLYSLLQGSNGQGAGDLFVSDACNYTAIMKVNNRTVIPLAAIAKK